LSQEFDAIEWCVSHGARALEDVKKAAKDDFVTQRKKTKDKAGGSSAKSNALKEGEEQCSDEFILSSMLWMLTIYRCAECWFKLSVREMPDGRRQHTRVPWHITARSQWVPSSRSVRALSQLMLRYAKSLNARVYETHMRAHLIQFETRPSDMDVVRLMNKHNQTYLRTVLEYEFKGRSIVANAYVRRVKYDRHIYPYIAEIYQWESGDDETTSSGSLARQSFLRQTSFFFLWDLLIMARFRFPFKARIGPLQHRDVGFVENFEKGRILGVPLIIWNFGRPCVFVPHRRRPELDYESIRRWRANSRRLLAHYGHRSGLELDAALDDLTTAMGDLRVTQEAQRRGNAVEPGDVADVDPANQAAHVINPQFESGLLRDLETQQYNRVYDCPDAVTAIAVWAQFLLEINNGMIVETDMRQFLLDAFEWIKP